MNLKRRAQVNDRITAVLKNTFSDDAVCRDIAFHMTDWKENLEQLVEIYEREDKMSDEQIEKIIFIFLAHVPNHLAAAKKLIGLGPIEDVFNVGVTKED